MDYRGRSCVRERNGKLTDMGDRKQSDSQDEHRAPSPGHKVVKEGLTLETQPRSMWILLQVRLDLNERRVTDTF